MGFDAAPDEKCIQPLRKIGFMQLCRRHVDRHTKVRGDGVLQRRAPGECLFDHPVAQANDEPRLLGNGHKLLGQGDVTVGGRPAQQCLGAVVAAGLEVDDRLVEQAQLICFECRVQFPCELLPGTVAGQQSGIELKAEATLADLCGQQGHFCALDQAGLSRRVIGGSCRAHGDGEALRLHIFNREGR